MSKSINQKLHTFFIILVSTIMIFLYGGVMSIKDNTLVSLWIPVSVAVIISIASGIYLWRIWKWLSLSSKFIYNFLIHLVCATGVLLFSFYFFNYVFASQESLHGVPAVVERKYTETRYHTKRISRRTYGRGTPYKVYYVEFRFASGTRTHISMLLRDYNRMHVGDTISLPVEKGLWGVPTIRQNRLAQSVPDKAAPTRRSSRRPHTYQR